MWPDAMHCSFSGQQMISHVSQQGTDRWLKLCSNLKVHDMYTTCYSMHFKRILVCAESKKNSVIYPVAL